MQIANDFADRSVVIVNWNTRDLLLQCLRSLRPQTATRKTETIVVDNASSDDSVEAVRSTFPEVSLILNDSNLGFAKANNIGLAKSTGRYLFLINSDVIVRDNCIQAMCEYMDRHREIGILGPKILNADLTLQESCKEFPTIWNSFCRALALDSLFPHCRLFSSQLMRYWRHDDIRAVDILSGCFWMVRREAVEQVGPLDEQFFMYAEDKDWCKRFWKAGWSVVYFPEAEAIHLAAASSAREPVRFYLEMNRANLRYWKKHSHWPQQMAIRMIMFLHDFLRVVGASVTCVVRPSRRQSALPKLQRSLAVTRSLLFEPAVDTANQSTLKHVA